MYFSEIKFVVEIDKKGHIDRRQNKENQRQTNIEKHPNCKFFHRINFDVMGFDIFSEINKIKNFISKSNEENLKSKFAKESLNCISNISKPSKNIKYFVEKELPTLQKRFLEEFITKNHFRHLLKHIYKKTRYILFKM